MIQVELSHLEISYYYHVLISFLGFLGGSVGKESACNAADTGRHKFYLGLGRFPGGGHGSPLQYSCLENPMGEEPSGLQSIGSHRVEQD